MRYSILMQISNFSAIIALLLFINIIKAQTINYSDLENSIINLGEVEEGNENFKEFSNLKPLLEGVKIVMLGEQSHGDATTYKTKIKLIKYLHQDLGFDLLVFESGFYDCKKAWDMIERGENVQTALGKSVHGVWSTTKEFKPLTLYLESVKNSSNPLIIKGFDNQLTGKYSANYFIEDLARHLEKIKPEILETKEWQNFHNSIQQITGFNKSAIKEFKKTDQEQNLTFILALIDELKNTSKNSEFWIQTLQSTRAYISDFSKKTDFRDKQMAENLIWIQEKNPESKIICWGATSHFLFNSRSVRMKSPLIQNLFANYYKKTTMMGEYIKNKFKNEVYTIGFTAYQGEYGWNMKRKIKVPKSGTLEYVLGQSEFDNFLIPLGGLKLDGMESRPLANFYMKTDISQVMDAVIFNRNMTRPLLDRNFFLEIYPENKYIKPEPTE